MKYSDKSLYNNIEFEFSDGDRPSPPVLCVAGYSGTGKTTVLAGLVAELKRRGFRVGVIKHDAHGFSMDHEGKDSWLHKKAGAEVTVISSPNRIGIVADADHDHHPLELLPFLSSMDIVLTEGFKRAKLPKIEVFRKETGKPRACMNDENLWAIVSDAEWDWEAPRFSPGDIKELADFIVERFRLEPGGPMNPAPESHTKAGYRN